MGIVIFDGYCSTTCPLLLPSLIATSSVYCCPLLLYSSTHSQGAHNKMTTPASQIVCRLSPIKPAHLLTHRIHLFPQSSLLSYCFQLLKSYPTPHIPPLI